MTDATARSDVRRSTRVTDAAVAATLLAGALVGWWWSVRMAGGEALAFTAAVVLASAGAVLILDPSTITSLT